MAATRTARRGARTRGTGAFTAGCGGAMTLGGTTVVEEIIRDGGYVTDFQFDPADLATLAGRVDDLTFVDLLDIGPGTGFGTTTPRPRPPDEAHLDIVVDAVSETGLTTLLLPGVAGAREVELIASRASAFDLVRVGVDADDVLAARSLLRELDGIGVETSLNLLKTSLVSPVAVADAARFAADHGADVVYVVDSAGGLAPAAVTEYVTAAIEAGARAGYHGHDNTGFGLANALAAVDAGAEYVDVSLQGTGRSAGNTQTALLCAQFLEDVPNRDWRRLRDLESVVSSVYGEAAGVAIEDVLYGAAGLHSSFAPDLRQVATEFDTAFTDVLATAAARGCSTVEAVCRAYESGGGRSTSPGVDTSS